MQREEWCVELIGQLISQQKVTEQFNFFFFKAKLLKHIPGTSLPFSLVGWTLT